MKILDSKVEQDLGKIGSAKTRLAVQLCLICTLSFYIILYILSMDKWSHQRGGVGTCGGMGTFCANKQLHIFGEHTIRLIRIADTGLTENAIGSTVTTSYSVNLGPPIFKTILKVKCLNMLHRATVIALWYRLHTPSCGCKFDSKHTNYAFFNLYY